MCLAVPGKLIDIQGDEPLLRHGRVSFGGIIKDINLSLVPEVKIGDYVLAHAGFAISTINEEEAQKTLSYLREIFGEDDVTENQP